MSSKVLAGPHAAAIEPMVWQQSQPRISSNRVVRAAANSDATGLMNRIAELESRAEDAAQAHREGFSEGEAHALAEAQTRAQAAVQPLLDGMTQSARDLCDVRARLRRQAEGDVVRLAIAIARRILHRELTIDPSAMRALVQVALERLDRQEIHRVSVHPSQAAAVRAAIEAGGRQVEVIADPARGFGALVFDTNRGKLDASINAQFEEIERGLTDRLNQ